MTDHNHDSHDHDHEHPHDDHDHSEPTHDNHNDHDHDHEHNHDEHSHGDHDHNHEHKHGLWATIAEALHLPGYAHDHGSLSEDAALYDNGLATRTVIGALIILGITTILQIFIVNISGSVALLGDTVHNLGDTLNSLPLLLAFWLARRKPNRRYTYGYGRAEDIAGLVIVASIVFSVIVIFWESVQKFLHPQPMTNLGWVAAAAIIGFLGNEGVAILQIRVGKQIGSQAMTTDGLHARTDGLTSLGVLVAVIGTALGFPIFDPIVGLVLSIIIAFIARDAIMSTWYRLMDAVDPKLVDKAEAVVLSHKEVKKIHRLQMRWLGHRLYMELVIALDSNLHTDRTEAITDEISHHLYHEISSLAEVTTAVVPYSADGKQTFWRESAHHRGESVPMRENQSAS
jgi:cation diffusion facilitator family transporter